MGGFAKHMAHPYEYTYFTFNDILDLITNLFNGNIELKEKLDGFNIMSTMNNNGQVVFIRNKSNINSENGGMTIEELKEKYKDKERQYNVFIESSKLIEKIFNRLGKEYFNIDKTHRKVINCECIIKPCTNVMPYPNNRIAFHGYKIYELINNSWEEIEDIEGNVEDIYEKCQDIIEAKPRNKLNIKLNQQDIDVYISNFKEKINNILNLSNLNLNNTIEDYKKSKYSRWAPLWCNTDLDIYNRICNDDKSVNLKELKKRYPEHIEDISLIDKSFGKRINYKIMNNLELFFLILGNSLINNIEGFENDKYKDVVIHNLEYKVKDIVNNHDAKYDDLINEELNKLYNLNFNYNIAEGLVFVYKGRRMKLTGSFAPINQILGIKYE